MKQKRNQGQPKKTIPTGCQHPLHLLSVKVILENNQQFHGLMIECKCGKTGLQIGKKYLTLPELIQYLRDKVS